MSTKEQGGLSRRSFLKGAGVAAAAVAGSAAPLAGCSSDAGASQEWLPKSWDYECDLLVIGYGGAGMWASLIGADECGQEVLVLEKAPVRGGGNSSINNGEFAVIKDAEGMRQYWHEMTQDVDTPSAVIDAWIEEGLRNCEYADKYELEYDINEQAIAGTIPEYSFLPGGAGCQSIADPPGFGMASFEILDQKRKDLGIEVLFDCHDEHLIQNPDTKEIVGAYTMIGSEEKTVKARKGVILCTGGFEFNEDMKRKYLKCYPFKFEGWKYNTGDGIKMVEEVGGKLWHMGMAGAMYRMWTRDPENDFLILIMPPDQTFIYTDRLGKRWVDEMRIGSPHNGWHAFTSTTRSATTITASQLVRVRPDAVRSRPDVHAPRRLVRVRQLHHHAPRRTARLGRLVRRQPGRSGQGLDHQGRHHRGARRQDEGDRQVDGRRHAQGHHRHLEPGLRGKEGRVSPLARHTEPAEQPAVLRLLHLSRLVLHLRRPNEERTRPGAGSAENPSRVCTAPGSFGNFHSHTYGITGGNVAGGT